ncbi:diacylglycerol/lipid kinase family protein [Chryseomicrobium palamuruense]|uniref:Diacylglycerol/lipid kinase family protein n=1 Tax=Chryseomicrobium palamuruense TaxID=682973 RepID=A0ABV8UZL6_9BACL
MKSVTVIINPVAGNGRALKKWQNLQPSLPEATVYYSEYPRHAVSIAKNLVKEKIARLVIVIGGDGTVHEVIEGTKGAPWIEVVAVSAGSGNDFGRTFTTVDSLEDIQDFVETSAPVKQMRIGRMHTSPKEMVFINNSGYGFDAKVVYEANQSIWKKRLNRFGLGKVVYYGLVVRELVTYQPTSLQLKVDDENHTFHDVWFVVVCNQAYFGGGMKISPHSNPEDDFLEATVVSGISRWKLLVLFGTVFLGWHTKLAAVKQFSGTRFELTTSAPLIGHADGEYSGQLLPGDVAVATLYQETWAMPIQSER